jgi:hypothetical protein
VNRNVQQLFQFQFDRRDVEQAYAAHGIDQKVQVTPFGVLAPCDRSKHAGVMDLMRLDDAPNVGSVGVEHLGWSGWHAGLLSNHRLPVKRTGI